MITQISNTLLAENESGEEDGEESGDEGEGDRSRDRREEQEEAREDDEVREFVSAMIIYLLHSHPFTTNEKGGG